MKEIDTRYLQVRGKIESPGELEYGQDVTVVVTVTSIEEKTNEDGTVDLIYRAKLFTA